MFLSLKIYLFLYWGPCWWKGVCTCRNRGFLINHNCISNPEIIVLELLLPEYIKYKKKQKKTVFRNCIKFHADPDLGSKKMSIWVRIQTPNVKFESGTKGGLNLRRQLIPPNFSFQLSKPNFEKSTKQNIVDYLPNEVSFDFIDVWWVSSSSCSSTTGSSLSASGSSSGDRSSAVILQLSHLGSIDNHD